MKKYLCILLVLLKGTTLMSQTFEYDNIKYTVLSESERTVEVQKKDYSGDIIIPEYVNYNGKKYTVTSIGYGAFGYLTNLKSISIPSTITEIKVTAFEQTYSLEEVTLHSNTIVSQDYSSSGSGISKIFSSMVKKYILGDEIKRIGNFAFSECSFITEITIPSSVESIGKYAFSLCNNLVEANLPNKTLKLDEGIFGSCNSLKQVNLPDNINTIPSSMFSHCAKLTSIDIPNSVKSIDDYAFYDCKKLNDVVLPEGVTSLGQESFAGCTSLTSFKIPSGITYINDGLFSGCSNITDIIINEGITSIGDGAFASTGLKRLILPSSVKTIKDYAFSDCEQLDTVFIPQSVTTFGDRCFWGCFLMNFYVEWETPPTLPDNFFDTSHWHYYDKLHCPKGSKSKYKSANSWSVFAKYVDGTETLTITLDNKEKKYGYDNPTYTYSVTGYENNDNEKVFVTKPTIYCSAEKNSDVGEYDIVASGAFAKEYAIVYNNAKLTINKVPLSIKAENLSRLYWEENPEYKIKYTGFMLNDNESDLLKTPTAQCSANKESDVGDYPIVISNAEAKNYDIDYKNGILSIKKRDLFINIDNKSKIYGEENPEFTYSYSGFVNNDSEEIAIIKPVIACSATSQSSAGYYSIYVLEGEFKNYQIIGNSGTLTIFKADQTLSWNQTFENQKIGDQIELVATSSAGLEVSFVSSDESVAEVYRVGEKYFLDCIKEGDVVVRAIQDGDRNYNAAVRISKTISITNPSSIEGIQNDSQNGNAIYTLSGQRISTPYSGIYIQNGKKILVK